MTGTEDIKDILESVGSAQSGCSPNVRAGVSWLQEIQMDEQGWHPLPCHLGSVTH